MNPTLLFIDEICPKPYDNTSIGQAGYGGTEQTVLQIAEGLSKAGLFNVIVEQHNREAVVRGNVSYLPLRSTTYADYVICLRDPRSLVKARDRFRNAKIYLYSHDLAGKFLADNLNYFEDAGCKINIVVSQYHKTQTIEAIKPAGYKGYFQNKVIYNPIADDLKPDNTPYDKNKLAFISSPHKGLEYALKIFESLIHVNPDFKLYITNPGYYANNLQLPPGVVNLGSIPHADVIQHLRTSLCLFYPNVVFPETFGKVMAEANAVGTPVLTHRLGAASEVCDLPHETIDCRQLPTVVDTIMKWHGGERPTVRGKNFFRLATVLKAWKELLK
jgi:glycosyltransferase involved in cell wall biosynthesis